MNNPIKKVLSAKKKAETKLQGLGAKAAKGYTSAVKKARSTPAYAKKVQKARYEGRI